jgi:hypothetical protein
MGTSTWSMYTFNWWFSKIIELVLTFSSEVLRFGSKNKYLEPLIFGQIHENYQFIENTQKHRTRFFLCVKILKIKVEGSEQCWQVWSVKLKGLGLDSCNSNLTQHIFGGTNTMTRP